MAPAAAGAAPTGVATARAGDGKLLQHVPRVRLFLPAKARDPLAAPPGPLPFQTASSRDGGIFVHCYRRLASFGADLIQATQSALAHPFADTLGLR